MYEDTKKKKSLLPSIRTQGDFKKAFQCVINASIYPYLKVMIQGVLISNASIEKAIKVHIKNNAKPLRKEADKND